MRLSVDDLLLIHRAAIRDLGQVLDQPLDEISSREIARLERILEDADFSYPVDPVGLAADVADILMQFHGPGSSPGSLSNQVAEWLRQQGAGSGS